MGNVAAVIALLVVVLSTLGVLLSYYVPFQSMKKRPKERSPPPPGSLGLPWIGETFDFVKHFQKNKLCSFFEKRQAKYGQTFKTSIMGSPAVILEPPAGLKFLFANEGKLVETSYPRAIKNLLGPDSMSVKTTEFYKVARRHSTSFLTPARVAQYLPTIEQITRGHLASNWQPPAGVAEDAEFQLMAQNLIKNLTFTMIAGLCLSLEPGAELDKLKEQLTTWAAGLFQLPINIPGFPYHSALKARAGIMETLDKLMARRREELEEGTATDSQDVLSFLLTQPDENGKKNTDGEVKDNILLLLIGGHDTSSSALTMTIMYLAKNPSIYERMKEEHHVIASRKAGEGVYRLTQEDVRAMKYTWAAVQETMRLEPPVAWAFREAVEDFEYNGYKIRRGWKLFYTNQVTHKNPKFFNNPEEYDPSRFEAGNRDVVPFTYIPFGGGVRRCPGNEFAKLEMLVFLHYLMRNYTWTLCEPKEPVIRTPVPEQANKTAIKIRKLKNNLDH